MITKITISNTTSYKEPTSLETDKKTNLIYGLNGSGKTTISDYLKHVNDPDPNSDFGHCEIKGFNPEQQKILVYNQKFVEETFYKEPYQTGVFTLAKENKEALENIKKAEGDKKLLQDKLSNTNDLLNAKATEIQTLKNDTKEQTWKIRTDYTGGDRVFDNAGFLDGLKGSKESLFAHIKEIPLEKITKTIEEIKKEVQDIGEGATQRDEIPLLKLDSTTIEGNSIFQEAIIGSKNSSVSELIEKLGNSDWVQQGLEYVEEGNNNCPFCQQETLSENLKKEIGDYFDESYENKSKELEKLKQSYQTFKNSIDLENYKKDFFETSLTNEITAMFEKLNRILEKNLNKIQKKVQSPSQSITLDSSKDAIDKINTFIFNRNNEIKSFNQKIKNRKQTIQNLKEAFWQVQRKEYNPIISNYEKENRKLEKEKTDLEGSCNSLKTDMEKQDEVISENQKKTINIDQTVEAINKHLSDFGIQDFEIVKHKSSYRIKREYEQDQPVFKSLSEGEKTVISFLYFVELCKGKESQQDTKGKIVVIDDPISSLSHIYVFNVAQLIKQHFTKPDQSEFLQCFILTHNLYFFHELIKISSKNSRKLIRVLKSNSGSELHKMEEHEIQNDYQSYWNIIKDHEKYPNILLANTMRNIFEYFFAFISKENWKESIEKLDQSFVRYMNRESHSDAVNIADSKDIDTKKWLKSFKSVFEKNDQLQHYNKYMDINP